VQHDDLTLLRGDRNEDLVVLCVSRRHLDADDGLSHLADDPHELQPLALKDVDAARVGPKQQQLSRAVEAREADARAAHGRVQLLQESALQHQRLHRGRDADRGSCDNNREETVF